VTAQDLGPASTGIEDRAWKKELDGSTSDPNTAANANQAQLISAIKAHITAGDKAAQKANDQYISAGQYLKELKSGLSQAEFLEIVRDKIGIGKSRAYDLLAIGDGTKTVKQVRDQINVRKIKHRQSVRSGTDKITENKRWWRENEQKWRDLWVAEGRSLADYRAGLNDHTSAVWEWRRAKRHEGIERERQAWLADHPDQTADDYDRVTTCAASDEDEAAYLEWLRGRKAERRETLAVEAERLASKLIELDRDTARAVHDLLRTVGGDIRLMCALAHRLDGDAS